MVGDNSEVIRDAKDYYKRCLRIMLVKKNGGCL